MSTAPGISCTVTNQLDVPLVVFNTFTNTPASHPPSTNAAHYAPVYTQVAVVPANGKVSFRSPSVAARMVIARQSDQFPLQVWVPPILAKSASTTVGQTDLTAAQGTYAFYLQLMSQPYAPLSLQFQNMGLRYVEWAGLSTRCRAHGWSMRFEGVRS